MTELDDRPPGEFTVTGWAVAPRTVHRRDEMTMPTRWRVRDAGLLARLIPSRWRWAHERYAAFADRTWYSCPLCLRMFGAHEWCDAPVPRGPDGVEFWPATIPVPENPTDPRSRVIGAAICPRCAKSGYGRAAWSGVNVPSRLARPAEVDNHMRPPYPEELEDLDDEPHGYTT